MRLPTISVINFSSQTDATIQRAVRAVNRQVEEDFMPAWGHGWRCRVDAPAFDPIGLTVDQLSDETPEPVRADGVIYMIDQSTLPGALGYHSINSVELPVGFVFTDLIPEWSVTLSHEVLEMIADPTVNIFVPGPHPTEPGALALHSYEVCDAVERHSYLIDGVEVSDFVTPWYFSFGEGQGTRNDFLGLDLPSFGVLPGCHLGIVTVPDLEFEIVHGAQPQGRIRASSRRLLDESECSDAAVERRRPEDGVLEQELEKFNAACAESGRVEPLGLDRFRVSRTDRRQIGSTRVLGVPSPATSPAG